MAVWLAFGAGCFVGFFMAILMMAFLFIFRREDDFERLYEEEHVRRNVDSSISEPLSNYQTANAESKKTPLC